MERRTVPLDYPLLTACRGELMGLALLWIMLFHAFYLPVPNLLSSFKNLGYLGVDIFLFLSALGLALSLSRNGDKQGLGRYFRRRFVRILPTYWLVVGLYGVYLRLCGQISIKTILWTLSTLFYWVKGPNYFNWYVPALLAFYLAAPLLVFLLRRCPWREVLVAVLSLGSVWLYFAAERSGNGHLVDFIFRIPVFLMGLHIGLRLREGRSLTLPRLLCWASGLLWIPLLQAFARERYLYLPPCFLFALVCVLLCLAVAWPLNRLKEENLLRRLLRTLGESSLEIYLLNVIFVLEGGAFAAASPSPWLFYAVTIPLNLLLGVGLHRLLKAPLDWLDRRLSTQKAT